MAQTSRSEASILRRAIGFTALNQFLNDQRDRAELVVIGFGSALSQHGASDEVHTEADMHAATKGHARGADATLNGAQWIKFGRIFTKHTGIAVSGLQVDDNFVALWHHAPVGEGDLGFRAAPGLGTGGVKSHALQNETL